MTRMTTKAQVYESEGPRPEWPHQQSSRVCPQHKHPSIWPATIMDCISREQTTGTFESQQANEIRTWANTLVLVSYRQHLGLVGMMYKVYTTNPAQHQFNPSKKYPNEVLSGSRPQVLYIIIFLASSILIEVLEFMHVFDCFCICLHPHQFGVQLLQNKRFEYVWIPNVPSVMGYDSDKII